MAATQCPTLLSPNAKTDSQTLPATQLPLLLAMLRALCSQRQNTDLSAQATLQAAHPDNGMGYSSLRALVQEAPQVAQKAYLAGHPRLRMATAWVTRL